MAKYWLSLNGIRLSDLGSDVEAEGLDAQIMHPDCFLKELSSD
jgi:hypothetical protein